MSTFVSLIKRNQLVAFVILAYALSWWPWVWYRLDPDHVDAPILPVGPLLAALIVLGVVGGWPAIRELLSRIVDWRVGWVWYVVVLLLPIAVTLGAVEINLLLGAQRADTFEVPGVGELVVQFFFILLWIGLGEEPGWRGFALPRLFVGRSALAAALMLGVIHVVWHLPLFGVEYNSGNVCPWGISVVCFSIVTAWVYLHTGGSVLMPMLMHASTNTIAFTWRMFEGGDQLRLWWVWCALWVITAVVVAASTGTSLTKAKSAAL